MTLAVETARIHMARALQRTIDGFIKRHYAEQHWDPDRKLTHPDIMVPLDPNFYTYSVFYNNCTFRMYVNFPMLSRRHQWTVQNVELTVIDFVPPLLRRHRGLILSFMLTVEQHMHDLKGILGYL